MADSSRPRTGVVIGVTAVIASLIGGFFVWLVNIGTPTIERKAEPSVVTSFRTSTVTVTKTPPSTVSTSSAASSSARTTPQEKAWIVRTPAGMTCQASEETVTCMGDFNGVEGYRWSSGESRADPVTSVSMPTTGDPLQYGTDSVAGPWVIQMRKSGITFRRGDSEWNVTFSRDQGAVVRR